MISPPIRIASTARSAAALPATGVNGGDADNATVLAAIDARIAALVARAPSPDDEALVQQHDAFDETAREQAELERETNALRDLAMEQMKNDDAILKKWIEMI